MAWQLVDARSGAPPAWACCMDAATGARVEAGTGAFIVAATGAGGEAAAASSTAAAADVLGEPGLQRRGLEGVF